MRTLISLYAKYVFIWNSVLMTNICVYFCSWDVSGAQSATALAADRQTNYRSFCILWWFPCLNPWRFLSMSSSSIREVGTDSLPLKNRVSGKWERYYKKSKPRVFFFIIIFFYATLSSRKIKQLLTLPPNFTNICAEKLKAMQTIYLFVVCGL